MKRCVILSLFLFFFCQAKAFEIGGNMLTYYITTPEGKNMTLYITPRPEITIQGKAYMSFSGYFTNNTEENYVENLIMLRRDGAQYFCYDSKTESEHLVFDFGLQKGDSYIDDFNNIEYEVTDVRDTLLCDQILQLIELQSKGGEGKRDIWVESIGSIYNGILPTNDYCKEMYLLINEYYLDPSEESLEYLCRFYPNNQYIKTSDMDITYLQWKKEIETDEDWEEYWAWYNAPTDLNAEFLGDTLHVWGRLRASGGLYPYAACEIQGNLVSLCFYSNIYTEGFCITEIDTRIPGFQEGEYLVNLINRTQELECARTITTQDPLPFLEGNPFWVYKYEHIPTPRSNDWMKYWVDTGDRYFTYYFLGGKKEIDGKVYTMMGEVECNREGEISLNRWLPIREENGIVYTITDSLPGVVDYFYNDEDYPIPYMQQGKECVLYNFSAEIGDKLYENHIVSSIDTYQLMDGTMCRVLKTNSYSLYEKLGYRDDDGTYGIIDPHYVIPIATNGHAYVNYLNAYYQDEVMLYKAPDAPDGLCVNDTIWASLDDAYVYARSYKANPYHEEVMSYILQLQAAAEPVTYTEGQMATIILPTAPDASKGKYYRLERCEKVEGQAIGQIVFEQELLPQAHVPYIIVPSEDFSIDPSALDLEGLSPDTVSIAGISFIGSYQREELPSFTGGDGDGSSYIDIIDTTPDCSLSPLGEKGKGAFIGALRAYLVVDWQTIPWNDPYNQGGTKGREDKMEIVLHDDGTGMQGIEEDEQFGINNEEAVYNLAGQRLDNSRFTTHNNSQVKQGIYIVKHGSGKTPGKKVLK